MENKRKSRLKWMSRCLVLAVFFAGVFGLRNATSIRANEGSNYSLELIDGDYTDSGIVKIKLTVRSGKKETLKLKATGTDFLDPESFVEDLDSESQSAVDVVATSDDNELELEMTGEIQTFSTVFEVNVDNSQDISGGNVSLLNGNGKKLSTLSFEELELDAEEEQEQTGDEAQEDTDAKVLASSKMISPMSLALPTPTNPVDVTTWAELRDALTSTSVDRINLKADITSAAAATVTTSKVINGNDNGTIRTWDLSTRDVTLGSASAGSQIILSDVVLTGNSATAMFAASAANSNNWEVQLDNVSNLATNARPLATLRNGKVLITGKSDLAITRSVNYMNAQTLVITDNAVIDAQLANTFYETTIDNSSVTVEGNSKLTVYSATDNVIRSSGQVDFTFTGQETEVDFSGRFTTSGSGGGLISINNDNSNINVLDGASVNVRSLATTNATPAIMMMSRGGIFTVDGGSKLYLESGSNTNDLSSVLRFRSRGYMTFDVKNNSIIEINRTGGNSAALRMYGDGNVVNVSSGSDVILTNKGSGSPLAPGSDGRNQGVHYDSGSATVPSQFNLVGEDSAVTIDADYGAAIDGNGSATNIVAGAGTYFVARGRTPGADQAIFTAGSAPITVTMDHPKYFDFRNERPGGGNIFQGPASSVFTLTNSMLAAWENGRDLDGNPSKSWTVMDSVWTGVNFVNGTSSNNPEFNSTFLGAPAYSRMTANNQAAVIDELRVPTDADKYIWGHASVPEGKWDEPRDAYTDEVHVRVEVYNADGSFAYEAVGSSIGDDGDDDGIAVYGDDPRAGIFKIDVPNGEFLTADQTINVIAAWRGTLANEGTSLVYDSEASDLQSPERIVLDVTPPEPTALTDANLNNATKVLSGQDAEVGAQVHVYYNSGDSASGTLLGTTTVQSDGTWTFNLPYYVEKTKELSVYLSDDAGQHTAAQVVSAPGETPELYDQTGLIKPPVTNISTGNINPYNDYAYHDAVFKGVAKYTIEDVIPVPTLQKDVTSSAGNSVSVGDTLTYSLKAVNTKAGSKDWGNVVLEDTLPEGLSFDKANHGITITLYNASETPGVDPGTSIIVDSNSFDYEESTRLLTINVGNVPALHTVVATFEVKAISASETDVLNKAYAKGDSPQELTFVEGPAIVGPFISLEAESNEVGLPDGQIYGVLSFVSAPTTIDFGVQSVKTAVQRINQPTSMTGDLSVQDTRKTRTQWKLMAKLKNELSNGTDTVTDALIYVYNGTDIVLGSGSQEVAKNTNTDTNVYKINDNWSEAGDGLKLETKIGAVKSIGDYVGTITWELVDAPI